ncbi:HAMP domain-containing protein [Candidatus Electronema sp. TJ]|uniref:HAMP domain-containing protein n=1 Tax=Candidatus Electronema sp. TJ TaxID=3401573 RepID=UPI003AA911D6
MTTLLQAADSASLKSKAQLFFVSAFLLTLLAGAGILIERGGAGGWASAVALAAAATLLCLLAAAAFLFQRQVLKPLADVQLSVQEMTEGHLDRLSRVKRSDEIGRLAETVNDLAVNMQEVLLFVWNHSQQSRELLERALERIEEGSALAAAQEDLTLLRQDNEDLRSIVTSFSYFEIRLEHERMLAESDCGKDGRCCDGGAACKGSAK